jgi:Tfp pilus assembly protein PilF
VVGQRRRKEEAGMNKSFAIPLTGIAMTLVLMSFVGAQTVSIDIPVSITGVVVVSDGSPLPGPVTVTMRCQNRYMPASPLGRELPPETTSERYGLPMKVEVLASLNGEFGFYFDVHREVQRQFQYALQTVDLTGCELTAVLPRYRSSVIHLGLRRRGDKSDVGSLVLQPLDEKDPSTVSVTSLQAPEDAAKFFRQAMKELQKSKPNFEKAEKRLEKAVAAYPGYADAWSALGEVRLNLQKMEPARDALEQAIATDPSLVSPYLSLASLEMTRNNWQGVEDFSLKAFERDSSSVKAQYLLAISNFSMEDLQSAEGWALKVRRSDEIDDYPITHYVLGVVWARKGEVESAAREFRRFIELKPDASVAKQVNRQLRHWERQGLVEPEA